MKQCIGIFLVVVAVLCAASCRSRSGDPGGSSPPRSGVDAGGFDKPKLLRALGDCVLEDYRAFAVAAAALDAATAQAEVDQTEASLEAARAAWTAAMEIWQRAELYQFGPAAVSTAPGGRDMRDPIYSWPLFGRCVVEEALASKAYEASGWANTSLVSARSLAAAEYLLFFTGADNACPADHAINTTGSWSELDAGELARRRLAYARVVTADVVRHANGLLDAWDPVKGNFLGDLENAGNSRSFTSEQMAFNAITDALFYLDLQLKNSKIGKPAGFLPDCASPPCLSDVESPWAKRSKEHIRQNVVGYEKLFRGCAADGSSLGFDDLLAAVGAEEISTRIEASIAEIDAALDALVEPTLEEDIQKNLPGVERLFNAFRANAALMKAEFVTVLDLELPRRVEGDND